MRGSHIRRAEVRDAETLRQLYQTSIRGLGSNDYSPEQIERWINRPVEAFAQDIQDTLVLLCNSKTTSSSLPAVNPSPTACSLASILDKAREIANQAGSDGRPNGT